MRTVWTLAMIAVLVLPDAAARACSQCLCGSPTPPGYLLESGGGRFGYGIEDRYLSKENGLAEEPGSEQQTEHRASAVLHYRPGPTLAFGARLPYVAKSLEESVEGEPTTLMRSSGLGDLELAARFDAMRFGSGMSSRGMLGVVGAVTAPTGSNDLENDSGERLEAHLQTGTGAWSGTAGLVLDAPVSAAAISASILARVNGTSTHGYHYGNAVLFNAGYARTLSPEWEGALELNGRHATRDQAEAGEEDPNSGGTLLYVAPSVRWRMGSVARLSLLVQVPIVQSLYGDQTEHTTARLGITFGGL